MSLLLASLVFRLCKLANDALNLPAADTFVRESQLMHMDYLVCTFFIAAASITLLSLDEFADINISLRTPYPLVEENIFGLRVNHPVPAQPKPASCH